MSRGTVAGCYVRRRDKSLAEWKVDRLANEQASAAVMECETCILVAKYTANPGGDPGEYLRQVPIGCHEIDHIKQHLFAIHLCAQPIV